MDLNLTSPNLPLESARMLAGNGRLEDLQKQFLNPQTTDQKKLKKAAQDFEAVFINQLLEAMDKTVDRSANPLSGNSEGYFRSMLNQEIANSMSHRLGGSGFGFAEAIYRQAAALLPPEGQETHELKIGNEVKE